MGRFLQGARGFALQDVGDSGWTTPTPTTVVGSTEASRIASTQAGSRLIYVSNSGDDSTGKLYFWNGTNIIDQLGSTSGAGGELYGTDPLNPSGIAVMFPYKHLANVLPRDSGTADIGSTASTRIGASSMPSAFRANKPDWFLCKRGDHFAMYEDMREWLDGKGLSATAMWSSFSLRSAGGTSATDRAIVGVYGPTSAGRCRITHPVAAFIASVGTANYKNTLTFGFYFDGSDRDYALRPVDWATFPHDESGNVGMQVFPSSTAITDLIYEDCHWQACGLEFNLQWSVGHTTPAATRDIDIYRCLITDFYSDGQTVRILATKAAGDPAQTFAANTTTTLTFPTETTDTSAMFNPATGVATVPSGYAGSSVATTYFTKVQVLCDVTAEVATNGTVELVLLINGSPSGASISVPGTGTPADLYKMHGWFRLDGVGRDGLVTGNTFEVAVKTTNATGTISVAGAGNARFVNVPMLSPKLSGVYAQVTPGARFRMRECVLARNGMNADPLIQATVLPANTTERYSFNILNHNIYSVGDCPASQFEVTDCVFLVGGAGEVCRNRSIYERNFIYSGYAQTVPEHNGDVYSTDVSTFNDNVLQRYQASGTASDNSHPGWGYLASSGLVGHQIRRNIVSGVHYDGAWALQIGCVSTPYWISAGIAAMPSQMMYVNNTSGTDVRGNIFDAMGTTGTNLCAIEEVNGVNHLPSDFMKDTTWDVIDTGGTVTATLRSGFVGTPTYQWYRYTANTNTKAAISGATSQSYVLTASDWITQVSVPHLLVACKIGGGQFSAGAGIDTTVYTNNVFVRPAANVNRIYYNQSEFANIPTVPNPSTDTVVPNDSLTGASSLSFSDSVEVNSTNYDTRAAAQTALGGSTWDASLKTHLQSCFVTVSSSDGLSEYLATAIGSTPATTALRRGRWDHRLANGKYIGNTIRIGRNMAEVV